MCYYCHIKLKNNDLLEFLNDTSEREWILLNLTMICHLLLCATGFNGNEIKIKAFNILNKYNKYYNISNYNNIINELKLYSVKEGDKDELHKFCRKHLIY